MKKIFTYLFFVLAGYSTFAQLEPVSNLIWHHTYSFPYNYLDLSWGAPQPTKATLTGYNVYCQNELYRFQVGRALFSLPDTNNCNDDFLCFNIAPFYIQVTAVYNNGLDESGYFDSAYCQGVAIGENDPKLNTKALYPNPTTGLLKIMKSPTEVQQAVAMDLSGKVLFETTHDQLIELADRPAACISSGYTPRLEKALR
ncbi:MAG: hypothetical protein PHQ65_12675 [Bacteroidales bacterium]|nr:hypothetical protein [Bacteroidales bacterium]MDD3666113.1 hypothetical protein [Bacteroidales bacterium]